MKKIGILTLAPTDNYGGILQALALHRALEQLGHEVTLLYKPHVDPYLKKIARNILENIPFHNLFNLKTKKKERPIRTQRIEKHRLFFKQEMNLSSNLYSYKDLKEYCLEKKLDTLVVGSDQVWRRSYINDRYFLAYFLNFINNNRVKKYSYAASFGVDHWETPKETLKIKELLDQFSAISVREDSGVTICEETFSQKGKVTHVLDPTLLFDKQFYIESLIHKYSSKERPQCSELATYILDENFKKDAFIKNICNYKKINYQNIKKLTTDHTDEDFISVPQWLEVLANTNFIVTDSFHGMVFSIIFEKNFVVLANHDRGLDRFTSLLTLLGLENRLISPNMSEESLQNILDQEMNYEEINSRLKTLRAQSLKFLHLI